MVPSILAHLMFGARGMMDLSIFGELSWNA